MCYMSVRGAGYEFFESNCISPTGIVSSSQQERARCGLALEPECTRAGGTEWKPLRLLDVRQIYTNVSSSFVTCTL